ncbi:Concanavalin A-like lectins/glucanase [Glarea lozoyensis ATCC 20868]|uniref:Concanavalin A-like lectins/glucanase n=1 Tax=Glarea lozoyensis (strain ATCC 20868 / MF5171) TaxID=1116229 RepID=S3DMP1_GLAL2|nr:Concanavalin A-like lectins/glucanase [Glarea lozoyensis ATCC 20868]EPE33346.1 Concanavalin A-like lectins/glucanase [Glarea lozoyensis ATCC 20868]
MATFLSLPPSVLAAVFLLLPSFATAQKDNAKECSCFVTNETSSGYFTSHRFFDFRNVASAPATAPAIISSLPNTTNAFYSSDYFTKDTWKDDWTIQNWTSSDSMVTSDATILMANSLSNVYLEKSDDADPSYTSHLTLRTSRQPDFQSVAEFDSVEQNFQYLSARFMARVIGSPGACAGMFTYLANDDPQLVQEADIEILTSGPRNVVQYTNQPAVDADGNEKPEATVNGTQPRDWSEWNVYRVDWMPKSTSWYVNGNSVAKIEFQVPKDPAGLMVNMWSNGGSWTGNMSTFDEAFLQIQWIELVYNTSGPYGGSGAKKRDTDDIGFSGPLEKRKKKQQGCKVVCSIDEQVNVTGTPAVLSNNTAAAPLGWKGEGMGFMAWMPLFLISGTAFGYL